MYEYACHEGNYAMGNILRGARLKEVERCEENQQAAVRWERCARKLLMSAAGLLVAIAPVLGHHAFGGEFDPNKPVLLKGQVTKLEWVNPHAWIHVEIPRPTAKRASSPNAKCDEWMVEGGTPNTLLRRGVTRDSLKVGTVLVIDGYQARDHSLNCAPTAAT